ncbi:phage major capsid protein, P2 family [Kushneria phosphatilytica]|uniref:Phage major capsid protein, P2 family n=1 Tax=Kushneria phosphatilytica TaxID=657387 RepID=A0A1S1NUK0_9GAMM|nr:phage major capsid protein, P2 family [Kushneria phosphatilytica]OHV11211.1 phage major capsid protein, P2 family [Kushneria phosphatilytica]QEL12216.1 phage major capsid protein, P2 family [Kushneria phosphatilytica]
MRNETRILFNKFASQVATLNGVPDATQKFAVEPTIQQRLEKRIQESSDFLSRINMIGVDELKGEKLALGISGPIAARTDVSKQDRKTRDLSTLDAQGYECRMTEFDTHVGYSKLDAWAKFPNFQALIRDAIVQQQALDRLMIGFNGKSAAVQTDPAANPMLQDVNIGWLQHYRTQAQKRVLQKGKNGAGVVIDPTKAKDADGNTSGIVGDYATLDALVYDVVNNLIEPWYRRAPGLVVIVGRSLMADKYFPLLNQSLPSEQMAADMVISQKRIGGLQGIDVPYFPDNALMVTTLDNLSLYWQNGARRRYVSENPKRNRIENYESSNDAYVVEDFGAGCLVENIELSPTALNG